MEYRKGRRAMSDKITRDYDVPIVRQPTSASIVVIDDTEQNLYTISRYLRRAGYEVYEGRTGEEALRLARKKPGLVILDVKLPDIMGYEVCRRIKSDPETASIPVLHTSATFVETRDKVAGLDGGADAYLAAPIKPDELIATVRALLRMHEAEKKAEEVATQWQTTFDAISSGVCLIDRHGRIERCNAYMTKLVNRTAAELVGLRFDQFAALAEIGTEAYARMRETRRRQSQEIASKQRWWLVTVDPVIERDQALGGAVCITEDITERKTSEESLARAEKRLRNYASELEQRVYERTANLEESNKALESFCYTIAHDLRAPLRAIQGLTSILLEDYAPTFDEPGRDYAGRVMAAAERMDRLLQDLLTYGRISHHTIDIELLDLEQHVRGALSQYKSEVTAANAEVRIHKSMPSIWGNSTFLGQVLSNLIGNALKFRRPGVKPVITIGAEKKQDGVRVTVCDNGIGIAPEHTQRIFDVFERLHPADSIPGTGIGLAIVKRAVERMNGRIGVESKPGEGSCFWFELPEHARRP